ncbi:MAG: AbrB/MazE/SpoVT family DNA-binding domain-containing protein [Pseudohongiellaceae bacterium]
MKTVRLSSKGQLVLPRALRESRHWETGQEFVVMETDEGVLLKPASPFPPARLDDVAGMLKGQVKPRSDRDIEQALEKDARSRWRGGD